MKSYTKIYLDAFGYDYNDAGPAEFIPCEICESLAVDIHHIDSRGMGGTGSGDKDDIKNLMALCRECHVRHGDISELKPTLRRIHLLHLLNKT